MDKYYSFQMKLGYYTGGLSLACVKSLLFQAHLHFAEKSQKKTAGLQTIDPESSSPHLFLNHWPGGEGISIGASCFWYAFKPARMVT